MKKRKWLKKGLALALSAAMVLGMVPGNIGRTVYAVESEEEQSEENWIDLGVFSILTDGVAGIDYEYDANMTRLYILSEIPIKIKNTDPSVATKYYILVKADVSANITLANVNIDVSKWKCAAFQIEDNSTGDVTVNLVGKNYLKSGSDRAGLQKNGSGENVGTLTITGNGELTATGGSFGAGIGGGDKQSACNIKINSGTITATGGGGGGAGIGGGDNGTGSDITIEGGSVKTMLADWGSEDANAIGGGDGQPAVTPTNGTDPVYLLEIENPNASDIQVNGNAYTPISHGEEKKIYAYLPAGTKDTPNMVTAGDTTKAYWYDTTSAKWNDTLTVASVPAADKTTYTYNGTEQTYQIAASDLYTVTGDVQKNAGEHTVKVSLNDKENTVWSDGTKEAKTYTFTIEKGTLDTTSVNKNIEVSCDKTTSKVSEVTLPENWSWEEADQSKVLEAGSEVDVTAVYNGSDKENYTAESCRVTIHITRKAHTDADGDGRCDVKGCGQYLDGVGARLAGYSLSLAGNIGVNFYMELSVAVAAEEDAYMNFELPNGTTTKVYVTGTHADGVTAQKETVNVDGVDKEYYVFPCEVAAKEMTANIKAKIIAGDMVGTEYTYTVKDYAEYILSHAEDSANAGGYDAETVALVKAMLYYGGSAQTYFGYQTEKLASDGIDLSGDIKEDWMNDDTYKTVIGGDSGVCTFRAAYLSLKSSTDICVYVKLAEGVSAAQTKFYIGDTPVTPQEAAYNGENCYKLTVSGVKAKELASMYTFKVVTGEGELSKTATLSYGAFSYAGTVFNSIYDNTAGVAKLRDVMNGMYLYYNRATAYAAAHSGNRYSEN